MRHEPYGRAMVVFLVIVGLCASAFSGEAAPPESDPATAAASAELLAKMKTKISVDFREAPIEDVLRSFAEQGDIDIVKGPQVTGTVTATLTDVPLDEAMDGILAVHGYGYMTTATIVRIVPRSELEQFMVHMETRIYHLDYANIDKVQAALVDMLGDKATIAAIAETGDILVTASDRQIELVDEFVEQIDREVPQILVEARIYDVSCEDGLDLGIQWYVGTDTLFGPGGTAWGGSGNLSPFVNSQFGSTFDRATTSAGLRFGVLNDHVDIDATLHAAQDDIKTRLLASPKILVLNNQQADIKIVEEIPYQELTQTTGGGNIGTTKFKEVGVQLTVTPHLTREGKIRLDVNPVFSVETGSVSIAIPAGLGAISSSQPIVNKRSAMTQALIGDGQTVVIGGLRKKDMIQEISKVPLLGDIPVLGALFKYRSETAVNSELIVFITPRLIVDAELSEGDARKLGVTEGELCDPQGPNVIFDCCEEDAD